jgi:cytochrome c-type biogenesis protein CcmE
MRTWLGLASTGLLIAVVLLAPAASARDGDGDDHHGRPAAVTLTGTVASIGREGFGLDTGSGVQRVEIERNTAFTRNGLPAGAGDLAVGETVTVKGRLERRELEARSVAIHSSVTLSGRIESIAPPALTVGGTTVVTSAATAITIGGAPGTLAGLSIGQQVTVSGELQADGTVLAASITAVSSVTLSGPVESIAPPALTVAGTSVVTSAATVSTIGGAPGTLAGLSIGQQVTVTGDLQADGTVLAASITAVSGVTLSGLVESITPPALIVSGATVETGASTVITVAGAPATLAGLSIGQQVTVTGVVQADGSILAQTVTAP